MVDPLNQPTKDLLQAAADRLLEDSPQVVQDVASPYVEIFARLGVEQFFAISNLIALGQTIKAQEQLRTHMNIGELATEKEKLAGLTESLAQANAEAREAAIKILNTGLKLALQLAIVAI